MSVFGVQNLSMQCTYWFKASNGSQTEMIKLINISQQECYENAFSDYKTNIGNNFLELIIEYVNSDGSVTRSTFKGNISNIYTSEFGDFTVEKIGRNFLFRPGVNCKYRSPFLIRVPENLVIGPNNKNRILVIPNNTGKTIDDPEETLQLTLNTLNQNLFQYSDFNNIIILQPVFPREKSYWEIYTHALDRDTFLTEIPRFKRLDLQLLAMIDDAKKWLAGGEIINQINTYDKFLMMGFSASAMFTNRFSTLHPEYIRAAIFGSPGGWPIIPHETYNAEKLRYPIGIDDLKDIAGIKFNRHEYAKVPMFYYLGDQDINDSIPFRDGYEPEDEELIFKLFGDTPVKRWDISNELLRTGEGNLLSRLYPGVGHTITKEINEDISDFIIKYRDGIE